MITTNIGFIGAGHMAGAMIRGMLNSGQIDSGFIGLYDLFPQQTAPYRAAGHLVYDNIPELVAGCPVVFLTVKPQNMDEVLPLVREGLKPSTVVVSIAAGVTAERIQGALGPCRLILAMPNTPMELRQGAVALGRVEPATQEDLELVKRLFSTCALVEEIPHQKMAEVIPLNGSGPAFFYRMVQVMVEEAVAMGLDEGAALHLLCQTMMGSAAMLMRDGDPHKLVSQVATPGGTTAAALAQMDQCGFDHSLRQGMRYCVARARELNEQK